MSSDPFMIEIKRIIILIHGFNVSNPENSVGLLRSYFERLGYEVVMLNYGYWPIPWQITRINPSVAKKLSGLVKKWTSLGYSVDIAAHSNGCTITHIASRDYDIEVDTVLMINPALKRKIHPCASANLVQVWCNGGDVPVVMGKWLRWLTPWARKMRPWGEMGMEGYKGDSQDPPVVTFVADEDFKVKAEGHSAVFKKPVRGFFLSRMSRYCFNKLSSVVSTDAAIGLINK